MTQRISTGQAAKGKMMSTRQASRHYDIPERTIRRWHAEGRLCDPEKRGRNLWWDTAEIDQLAEWRRERTAG